MNDFGNAETNIHDDVRNQVKICITSSKIVMSHLFYLQNLGMRVGS